MVCGRNVLCSCRWRSIGERPGWPVFFVVEFIDHAAEPAQAWYLSADHPERDIQDLKTLKVKTGYQREDEESPGSEASSRSTSSKALEVKMMRTKEQPRKPRRKWNHLPGLRRHVNRTEREGNWKKEVRLWNQRRKFQGRKSRQM